MAKKIEVTKGDKGKGTLAARDVPAHPLLALRQQMDRLFDEFLGDWRLPSPPRELFEFEPFPVPLWSRGVVDVKFDVSETDDAIEITAELPGIDEKDVELRLSDGILTMKGEKKAETETRERDYYLSERRYGSFARSMRVPESVDRDKITARFDKGVLTVTLPKRPEARSKKKRISISRG
ncbi:MAG: Hsp20/alpha crystallin family protein [Kiloniellaceae bacterium]